MKAETKGLWLGLVGIIFFSITLPATRLVVADFGTVPAAFYRATLGGLGALAYLLYLRPAWPNRKDTLALLITTVFIVFGFPLGISVAMTYLPSARGGVVLGITPLLTALFGALRFGERPSIGFWITAAIGSLIVILYSLWQSHGGLEFADWALIVAAVSASYGYAEAAKLSQKMGGPVVISWVLVFGLTINLPMTLYFAFQAPNFLQIAPTISIGTWVALLFLGLVSAFIANFFWYNGLALGGIARVGQVQLLQPFMTFLAASLFLPEPITLVNILFATAVVAVVMIGRKMPIRKVESKSAVV